MCLEIDEGLGLNLPAAGAAAGVSALGASAAGAGAAISMG